jgi:hypothetical protein
MTIYRGRWQEHLKTRGEYYKNAAAELDAIHAKTPDIGADALSLGLRALAYILE